MLMDALRSSSSCNTIFVAESCCAGSRAFYSARAFLRPAAARYIGSSASKLESGAPFFARPISLQQKRIWTVSSSVSVSAESEVEAATVCTQGPAKHPPKTVHVKFQLQQACSFGEKFLLAGDDPIFGLWDPLNAIPLDWSEDHVWSIELDIPIGRTFQYKFILKCNNGDTKWQPGPDRILQTWETMKTIVILEDWRNAELQKIIEEEAVASLTDKSIANLKKESIFPDTATRSNGMVVTNEHLMGMKDEEVMIDRGGEAFKNEVPKSMAADASIAAAEEGDLEVTV